MKSKPPRWDLLAWWGRDRWGLRTRGCTARSAGAAATESSRSTSARRRLPPAHRQLRHSARTAPASPSSWPQCRWSSGPCAAAPRPRSAPGTSGSGSCCRAQQGGWVRQCDEGVGCEEGSKRDGWCRLHHWKVRTGVRCCTGAHAGSRQAQRWSHMLCRRRGSAHSAAALGSTAPRTHRLVPTVGSLTGSKIISLLLAITWQRRGGGQAGVARRGMLAFVRAAAAAAAGAAAAVATLASQQDSISSSSSSSIGSGTQLQH